MEPEALLLIEICASSGVGEDTAEPSWLPLVSLLTLGASGVTDSETETDAVDASAVVGAEGVSMVVATGVTWASRSGADSWIVEGSAAPPPLEAIEPPRLELNHRRAGGDCVVVLGVDETGAQPSSLVASTGAEAAVVSADVDESAGGGATCVSDAAMASGMVGIVPIESS